MAQGDLPDAQVRKGRVQAAPPQLGAQGAGVLLLPLIEHNVVYRHLDAGIGHVQLPAQVRHGVEAHTRGAGLQGDGVNGEGNGIKGPQPGQRGQRYQAVLAAGYAHGHRVPRVDHAVILHAPAHLSQKLLHVTSLPGSENKIAI